MFSWNASNFLSCVSKRLSISCLNILCCLSKRSFIIRKRSAIFISPDPDSSCDGEPFSPGTALLLAFGAT